MNLSKMHNGLTVLWLISTLDNYDQRPQSTASLLHLSHVHLQQAVTTQDMLASFDNPNLFEVPRRITCTEDKLNVAASLPVVVANSHSSRRSALSRMINKETK
jgi:hypothetical protein